MGLHMPGAAFVNPGTPLRQALTRARRCTGWRRSAQAANDYRPWRRSSTRRRSSTPSSGCWRPAARPTTRSTFPPSRAPPGSVLDWNDLDELILAVPLIARVYPNGSRDVNDFHAAGGMGFVIGDAARRRADPQRRADRRGRDGVHAWFGKPLLEARAGLATGRPRAATPTCCARWPRPSWPMAACGWSRATSAARSSRPARSTRNAGPSRRRRAASPTRTRCSRRSRRASSTATLPSSSASRARAPTACPKLHKLTPALGVLQDRGQRVALITDGRMSGASGKVPAAIHVSPEALPDGPLARVRDGDIIHLNAHSGVCGSRRGRPRLARAGQFAAAADCTGRELMTTIATTPRMAPRRCCRRWRHCSHEPHRGRGRRRHPRLRLARAGHLPPPPIGTGRERSPDAQTIATTPRMALGDAVGDGGTVRMSRIAVAESAAPALRLPISRPARSRCCPIRSSSRPANMAASRRRGRSGRRAGVERFRALAISFAGPVGGEVLKLDQQPVGHPPRADEGTAGRRALHHRQRFRRGRACRRGARRLPATSAGPTARFRPKAWSRSSGRAPDPRGRRLAPPRRRATTSSKPRADMSISRRSTRLEDRILIELLAAASAASRSSASLRAGL